MSDVAVGNARVADLGLGVQGTADLMKDEARMLQVFKMAEMGIMASSILHEIRQPLFSIKGYLQMLLFEAHKAGSVDQRLVKIHELVEDLERRATTFLDFSRSPNEHMMPIELNEPIRGAVELFRHRLEKSRIELHLELASGLPPINGSFSMLRQVLVNLFQNSLYTLEKLSNGEGRDIWIRSRLMPSRRKIEVLFADSGDAIAPEHVDKVFDFFFTTKPNGEGTGLGLAISHAILRAHDGELCLVDVAKIHESWQPTPATVFKLVLPVLSSSR